MEKKREELRNVSIGRLNDLLSSLSGNKDDTIISTALTQLLEEMFNRLYTYFIAEQNKPLRNAAFAHTRELKKLAEQVAVELDMLLDEENGFQCNPEHAGLEVSTSWKPEFSLELVPLKTSLFERFSSMEKRGLQLFEHYSSRVLAIIDTGFKELAGKINGQVTTAFELFIKDLKSDYLELLHLVKEQKTTIELTYNNAQNKAAPELSKITTLINGFEDIAEKVI